MFRHACSIVVIALPCLLVAVASPSAIATPAIRYVATDGDDLDPGTREQPYRTIQRAVQAAASGDTIAIFDGTYGGPGNVNVAWQDKNLAIRSESNDPQLCVIECAGDAGFVFSDTIAPGVNEISFSGLTVVGASMAVEITGGYAGPPYFFESPVKVTVSNCLIRDGTSGLIMRYANLTIDSTRIVDNQDWGISAYADQMRFLMSDCLISGNAKGCDIGGAWMCTIDVATTDIVRNGTGFTYGYDVSNATFRHCRMDSNSTGNGIRAVGFSTNTSLTDCSSSGNARNGIAYGMESMSAVVTAERCQFSRNGMQGIAISSGYAGLHLDEVSACANSGWGIGGYMREKGETDLRVRRALKVGEKDLDGFIDIRSSRILNNTLGGADLRGQYYTITVDSTIVADNSGPGLNLASGVPSVSCSLAQTTIANNTGHGIEASVPNWTASHLLVAHNTGAAINLLGTSTAALSCTDLYGNLGGDWTPPIAGQLGVDGNISADPLFCEPTADNYTVAENSPCLGGNHPAGASCTQIGARGTGCGIILPPRLAQVAPLPSAGGPVTCGDTISLGFRYIPGTHTPALRGYSIRVAGNGPITFAPSDFTVHTQPAGAQTFFQVYENAPNDCTVDFTILGADTTGIAAETALFAITFHGTDDGLGGVHITQVDFRDVLNQPFTVEHETPASIVVDCGPPPPVVAVTAAPGHQEVTLAWTDPQVADLSSLRILRGMWHDGAGASAYPLFGLAPASRLPARPDSLAAALASGEWTVVADVAPGAGSFIDDVGERGIYFYEIFAVDAVGNASAPSAASMKATNYWLGDVAVGDGDGYVNIFDMSALGDSYGVSAGHPSFSPLADVGPTDTARGDGLPLPDGLVAFDDLMIFGQTFGEVGPAKSDRGPAQDLMLIWRQENAHEWSCRLARPCADLRGLRVTAAIPEGELVTVTAGPLLSRQSAPVFLKNAGADLDVGLCLMGRDLGFEGEGELFRVTLTGEVDLGRAEFEARSVDNERLAVTITTEAAESAPLSFAAGPSYPNPFNATTTIQFDLPEPQRTEVAVYSIDGRRVRSLLSQQLPAGRHTAHWAGDDDGGGVAASGTYFFRIEAGPYRATQKMVLAK